MEAHGTIVKWFEDKHFGFIAVGQDLDGTQDLDGAGSLTGGEDVFFHGTALAADAPKPHTGMVVRFAFDEGPKGWRATLVEAA